MMFLFPSFFVQVITQEIIYIYKIKKIFMEQTITQEIIYIYIIIIKNIYGTN